MAIHKLTYQDGLKSEYDFYSSVFNFYCDLLPYNKLSVAQNKN